MTSPCELHHGPLKGIEADWLVVGCFQSEEFSGALGELDESLAGRLKQMQSAGDLPTSLGEVVPVLGLNGLAARRLLLVGLGKSADLTPAKRSRALQVVARKVSEKAGQSLAIAMASFNSDGKVTPDEIVDAVLACGTGCVGQDIYRQEPAHKPLEKLLLACGAESASEQQSAIENGQILARAVNLTRELVNRTAADIYPESFAKRAAEEASAAGLGCEIMDADRLAAERMGSLLAVAQGSDRPPCVVRVEHMHGGDAPTIALVGKGVTFDSGGLSIKPSDGMKTMKCDMAGAATVLGAMTAIARLKLPVNVVGYMGLVENLVSGRSYKLGDVLTARNGVTIEVLNTDAEGRLVLADVLSYAVDKGASQLVDLATLTGACVVALGEEVTGLFTNDADWAQQVKQAAATAHEDVWELPMHDSYAEQLKSDVADCKNVGTRWGGAITAAKFLEKFVSGKPWVHLDIAGPSFASANAPHREGGATGCMVRTLIELVRSSGK